GQRGGMARIPVVNSRRAIFWRSRLAGSMRSFPSQVAGGALDNLLLDIQAYQPAPGIEETAINRPGPAFADHRTVDFRHRCETVGSARQECFVGFDCAGNLNGALDEWNAQLGSKFHHG